MAITRNYKTEYDCARCWVIEGWSFVPSWVITEGAEYWRRWGFFGGSTEEGFFEAEVPMWETLFVPNDEADRKWVEDNALEVADLGFTLVYHGDDLWGVGIDSTGFDFYKYYWLPLYRLRGFQWHADR